MQIYYFNLHFIMVENTVDENIIGAPKLLNNYGAINLFIFSILDFSLLLLVKVLLLIIFAPLMV